MKLIPQMRVAFLAILALIALQPGTSAPAAAQTFLATRAIDVTKCERVLGLFNRCVNIESDRITRDFTRAKLGQNLFANTWSTSSDCKWVDASEQVCKRAVSAGSDPLAHRLVWGTVDRFLRAYGGFGSGAGQFSMPKGVSMARAEGEWHVVFVADAGNNRVAVIALGDQCRCGKWMGEIDGSESGVRLSGPSDVSWDHRATWSIQDDRVFIADTENNRIVVYGVNLDPVTGTMSKHYIASLGTEGSGPMQLRRPEGVEVRSSRVPHFLITTLYVSDTGNQRVLSWSPDNQYSSLPTTQSAEFAAPGSSEFLGLSLDAFGDLTIADRGQNRLLKLKGSDLSFLTTYGNQTNAWAVGSFNAPTDVETVRAYHQLYDVVGTDRISIEHLPYSQTTEAWSASTGGQTHRLGVEVGALQAHTQAGGCWASFWFHITGQGSTRVVVKNSLGAAVRGFTTVVTPSGWKNEYWDGRNDAGAFVPGGTYTYEVRHESGYTYDDGLLQTVQSGTFPMDCYTVNASTPAFVTQKGTFYLTGSATHPSDSWTWRQSYNGGSYNDWEFAQNSSFTTYGGERFTADWELSARRPSDGATSSGYATTLIDVPECPGYDICPPTYDRNGGTPMLGDSSVRAPMNGDSLRHVPGQGRMRDHYGSGAWVGGRTERGPRVVQLFSLFGTHQGSGTAWPNALASEGDATQISADGDRPVKVAFTSGAAEAYEVHKVKFSAAQAGFRDGYVGLALDPDLGLRASDDSLGMDTETGLVWVADPDSGAIGYMVTGRPSGSQMVVRQFSRNKDTWHPDPAADSAAYAELTANASMLTGRRDDVRFVIAVGPVALAAGDIELGVAVIRAANLTDLRRQAAEIARRTPAVAAGSGRTGITRFRITQAPPQAGAQYNVERVSPDLIPGLADAAGLAPGSRVIAPDLREQVRANGIMALAFAVPDGTAARVEIRIHDAAGRIVRHLSDESFEPGAYRLQWDGNDEAGAKVAPGVYIAVMQAPGYRGTTRLVVVR